VLPAASAHFNKINLDFRFIHLNNIEGRVNFLEVVMTDEAAAPAWLAALDEEDVQFLRRFLLCSGSLKALAEEYHVSYPTVRGRLDRLIAKVRAVEDPRPVDPFERKLRVLTAEGKLPPGLAKELLAAHRSCRERRDES
jgi:hypothetical protein